MNRIIYELVNLNVISLFFYNLFLFVSNVDNKKISNIINNVNSINEMKGRELLLWSHWEGILSRFSKDLFLSKLFNEMQKYAP